MISYIEILSCLLAIVCSLWRNVFSGPLPIVKLDFFYLMLSCMNFLYILDVNPLLNVLFENIFSHQ